MGNMPWVALGNFNEATYLEEGISQRIYNDNHGGPSEFPQATLSLQLIELPSVGGEFTWNNKSVGPTRLNKLDKTFTNISWIDLWPQSKLELYRSSSNDHATIIISCLTLRGV